MSHTAKFRTVLWPIQKAASFPGGGEITGLFRQYSFVVSVMLTTLMINNDFSHNLFSAFSMHDIQMRFTTLCSQGSFTRLLAGYEFRALQKSPTTSIDSQKQNSYCLNQSATFRIICTVIRNMFWKTKSCPAFIVKNFLSSCFYSK